MLAHEIFRSRGKVGPIGWMRRLIGQQFRFCRDRKFAERIGRSSRIEQGLDLPESGGGVLRPVKRIFRVTVREEISQEITLAGLNQITRRSFYLLFKK
jgi:hypothetical protein